jgi:GAF domain-containing protein
MDRAEDIFYLPLENAVPDHFCLGTEEDEVRPVVPNLKETQYTAVQKLRVAPPVNTTPVCKKAPAELAPHLNQLSALIANITEAYTVAIFLADNSQKILTLGGLHTLSRDFLPESQIGFGCGLIGWTAENGVRISVCPFEHDARTLLCYGKDQDLKSFIAVPILDSSNVLLGVISCDSKKNYAFAKVTEKILLDCAAQAAVLISLVRKTAPAGEELQKPDENLLDAVIEGFREHEDESGLLNAVAELPPELVKRDALVVVTTAEWGVGQGKFYSTSTEARVGHRLLEMVCKHKKIICAERSVHALPVDDIKQRSFLSIPFHVLGREAGSFNLLSRPHEAFNASQIAAMEKIAKVVGHELERIRLREKHSGSYGNGTLLSWKHFSINAKALLAEAKAQRASMSFLRLNFKNLMEIEEFAGVEATVSLLNQLVRLVEQTVRPPALACTVYGSQIVILSESSEAERLVLRLRRLIERINTSDYIKELRNSGVKLGSLLNRGLEVASVRYPIDGTSVTELAAKSRATLETSTDKQVVGEIANAGNW